MVLGLVCLGFSAGAFLGCGQSPVVTVNDCIAALQNEDPYVRLGALHTLFQMGPEAAPATQRLCILLTDDDPNIAAGAARVLAAIGPAAESALPALEAALRDERESRLFGPVWSTAAQAMGSMGPKGIAALIALLESDDPAILRAAAYGLHFGGPAAAPAVPTLIQVLNRNDPRYRKEVIFALQGIGPPAKEAVPALITMLHSDDFHTQYWACRALAAIGPEAEPAIPVLMRLTKEGVTSVRRNAAAALGHIGPKIGPEGVSVLLEALRDPAEAVREQAVIALGRLGSFAADAAPAIEFAIVHRRLQCRPQAAVAIWRITGRAELAIQVIREEIFLPENQMQAIWCLKELGPDGAPATPDLLKLLESPDGDLREAAAEVIAELGPAGKAAIPALERLLFDRDPEVRKAAARALRALGQPVPESADVPISNL